MAWNPSPEVAVARDAAKKLGDASSVDVDNVPWVRGLALRINRAMEAMGVEEGYVVVGGKIVKAGGE